jgi:hypothetical protein
MALNPLMYSLQSATSNALLLTDGVDTRAAISGTSFTYATDWIEMDLTVAPLFSTPGRAVAVAGSADSGDPANSIDLTCSLGY